jgi:alkanesulfonate monooxygenase SsuD/methylene tetrahydromethanopterin reductase-like flavin-dependent oxidoreductase (luciferase family)
MAQFARDPSIKSASVAVAANLIGTPKTVVERIHRYESLGVDLFLLQRLARLQWLRSAARPSVSVRDSG